MSMFSYFGDFYRTAPYLYFPYGIKKAIQKKHLNDLLKYAKEHSEYYSTAIPDDFDFNKIKPINKLDFIENFDKIVTDKEVTIDRVLHDIKLKDNEPEQIDSKYAITMTSGSTGNPTIILQDKYFQNISSIIYSCRAIKTAYPVIMVGEAGEHGIESNMFKHNKESISFVKNIVTFIDVSDPIDEIIDQLKKAGPGTIMGYTGILTIVANRLIDKNIKIKEKKIFVSGEQCSEYDKNILRKAFDCKTVRVMYGCTEAGTIAQECKCGHLHINSDWIKIEPVDENNNPVGYGVLSDKLLLTNLMNRIQPIIRYEVTDKIILHKGCECGCKDDWLEIEGRSNDNLQFESGGETVTLPSMSLLIAMADINKNGLEKFKNYQIAVHKNKLLSITLDYAADADTDSVNAEIKERVDRFFANYGIDGITYEFTAGEPHRTQRGKYKRIYIAKD